MESLQDVGGDPMHILFPRAWKGRWEGSIPAAGSLEEELLGQAGP